MSSKVDKFFQPIIFISTFCFLRNPTFNTRQNDRLLKFCTMLRIAFIILTWYLYFEFPSIKVDIIERCLQLSQKAGCCVVITIGYGSAHYKWLHINKIKRIMKQNSQFCPTFKFSPFILFFILLFTIYAIETVMDYTLYASLDWQAKSRGQFAILVIGYVVHTVFGSEIYAFGWIIHQQFKLLNEELKHCEDKLILNQLTKTYSDLHDESEYYNKAFSLFILCKILSTYMCVTIAFYYLYVDMIWIIYTIFWIVCMSGELAIIIYYCDRIQHEVLIYSVTS